MGLRGPPPKPTVQKKMEGTFRPDRAPEDEPTPPAGIPDPPKLLTGRARDAWDRIGPELNAMGVLTRVDGIALELLCDAYAEWVAARDVVRRKGTTYTTKTANGRVTRPHPAVRIAAEAWRRVHRMLLEFGLTPAARTRVNRVPTGDDGRPQDPWEDIKRGPRLAP